MYIYTYPNHEDKFEIKFNNWNVQMSMYQKMPAAKE